MELTVDGLKPTRSGKYNNSATAYTKTIKESTGYYNPKETIGITPKGSVFFKIVTPAKDFSQLYLINRKGVLKILSNIKTSYGSKTKIETSKNGVALSLNEIEKHKNPTPYVMKTKADITGKSPKMKLPENVEQILVQLKTKSRELKILAIKSKLIYGLKKILCVR